MAPISRSMNGCDMGAYGTDLIPSTSGVRQSHKERVLFETATDRRADAPPRGARVDGAPSSRAQPSRPREPVDRIVPPFSVKAREHWSANALGRIAQFLRTSGGLNVSELLNNTGVTERHLGDGRDDVLGRALRAWLAPDFVAEKSRRTFDRPAPCGVADNQWVSPQRRLGDDGADVAVAREPGLGDDQLHREKGRVTHRSASSRPTG